MGERHGGIAAAELHVLGHAGPVRRRRREAAEIVEAELGWVKAGKL